MHQMHDPKVRPCSPSTCILATTVGEIRARAYPLQADPPKAWDWDLETRLYPGGWTVILARRVAPYFVAQVTRADEMDAIHAVIDQVYPWQEHDDREGGRIRWRDDYAFYEVVRERAGTCRHCGDGTALTRITIISDRPVWQNTDELVIDTCGPCCRRLEAEHLQWRERHATLASST